MQETEKKEAAIGYQKQLSVLAEMLQQQPYDMLILDEIMACLSSGFLQEEMVLSFLQQVPEQTEVVLTGRNPPASLLEKADYISEIRNIRHPYEKHIKARKGIEF
jgi:cob(I)alamin adenosyltransferase